MGFVKLKYDKAGSPFRHTTSALLLVPQTKAFSFQRIRDWIAQYWLVLIKGHFLSTQRVRFSLNITFILLQYYIWCHHCLPIDRWQQESISDRLDSTHKVTGSDWRSSWQVLNMDKNISWDLNGEHSLEEFWGDKRGGEKEWRENRGAMNKYVIHMTLRWLPAETLISYSYLYM